MRQMNNAPTISLVVASRNRTIDLQALIASIESAYEPMEAEIVVVDDASDPNCDYGELRSALPMVVVRNQDRQGAALSRNRGVKAAAGTWIGFLDDDARVTPHWFQAVRDAIRLGVRAGTGRVIRFDAGSVSRARQWRYDRRYSNLSSREAVGFLAGGNSFVPREAFLKSGGFPDIPTGSDNLLVKRLFDADGIETEFLPDLVILHRNSKGYRVATREAWRSGRLYRGSTVEALRSGCTSVAALRAAPIDVAVVNTTLQAIHTAGALTALARSDTKERTSQ